MLLLNSCEQRLGASRLLDTHDLVEKKIDERSLTTYLMTLQTALIRHNAARLAVRIAPPTRPPPFGTSRPPLPPKSYKVAHLSLLNVRK